MNLSLYYFAFILFILLSIADSTKFNIQCPTSRRLLLFGGLNLPVTEKKSHRSSSSSKPLPASPPKYARASDSHGLTVFIRPQTSNELGHKVHSYTHLLKSKLYTDEEKAILKQARLEKKNQFKKRNSSETTKTQELVALNDEELNRCKALLHIDATTDDEKKTTKSKKDKSIKQKISAKVKNVTHQGAKTIKNKVAAATTTDKKGKASKGNSKTKINEKKTAKLSPPSSGKTNENRPFASSVNNIPSKSSSPSSSQSTINTKVKHTKPETITIIQKTTIPFNTDDNDDKNNSVVDRALHFMKNMFQLSDHLFDENEVEEEQIIGIPNEQQRQHHHHSRKLLSIDEDDATTVVANEFEADIYLTDDQSIGISDVSSFVLTSISKRQLLSVKANKRSKSSKTARTKDKNQKALAKTDASKPKVGWAYRYRISRYLDAQKMKRTGNKNKKIGGGKSKQLANSKQNQKKITLVTNAKVSKRKLLEYHNNDDLSSENKNDIFDHDTVKSVSVLRDFLPKRQLLTSKTKEKYEEDEEDDVEKRNIRRRRKPLEELTDPIAIVQSYDRGLHKPRVGWHFRYRISRYIDSLRENIREDQERLKLGLQAIKRKTPQELSGRRKRVLDKPFAPDSDQLKKQAETLIHEQDNKPNVGWRYRYRISKMVEAKKRGEYIDDEAEKRQARLEPKKTSPSSMKSSIKVDERIEEGKDLDPELRKINDEGKRVGWAYRYRIRRKLDHLKQQQAETGVPFDLATLSGKGEKKVGQPRVKSTDKKTTESVEEKPQDKTKSVGWEYRYRVSKMRDAQKREKSIVPPSKKRDLKPSHEQLHPEVPRLTPEDRVVGWQYRYRIRRKLDALNTLAARPSESGKRMKKPSPSKRKGKEKIIKQVEESIEKILNIDNIDRTPFMEYFRRTSSYVLFGLLPTAKNSLCLLPLPVEFSFCYKGNDNQISSINDQSKQMSIKKLRTKKEQRAKQFIRSHTTKFGAEDKATERRIDETMRNLYKQPSLPPLQTPPSPPKNDKIQKKQRTRSSKQPKKIEHEESITKQIGVESKKNKNKKQFQIIGQEVKTKQKHLSPPSTISIPSPTVEVPITTTTPSPPLRTIAEVIQAEAATILAPRRTTSRTPEEIQEEINETNESIQEQKKLKAAITTTASTPTLVDSTTSGEEDNGSTSSSNDDSKINQANVPNTLDLEKEKSSF